MVRKQQIELTRAGYDLLDKKRLALMQEILRLQDEVVHLAANLQEMTANSRRALAKAEALVGTSGVRVAAMGKKHEVMVEMADTTLLGVHVPQLKVSPFHRDFSQRELSSTGTSLVIDEVAESYEQNIEGMIRLADGEMRLSKLMKEIMRTTRRLKALEHIVIPRLQSEYHYIDNALEERERSQHFALKLAKKILTEKHQSFENKNKKTKAL